MGLSYSTILRNTGEPAQQRHTHRTACARHRNLCCSRRAPWRTGETQVPDPDKKQG